MAWIGIIIIAICATLVISKDIVWQRPGCHKVGHTRTIEIPDCVQFSINTNACRGYCESYAVPSAPYANGFKIPKPVTSVGQCCNIMETEDVNVMLSCVGGARNVTFKSATKCSCYHCKKD
ncbi:thyrostimulin alpha-2 subunit [Contarinia nasturtii]|uniref:thyrostimulin alpha-2 subunit n=1 Tax=Contarinia nasturtii TaxID=265458 RepID=UPI0012D3AA8D|nr:thyrostimulin alpha-2 subunit [Contarinia nasturtii]